MKKKITSVMTIVLIISICLLNMMVFAEGNKITSVRKFNVVFVVDASNSMNSTDSQGWRYESIDQFMSLLSMNGNYVGSVVFNGEILSAEGVSPIENKQNKKVISDAVKNVAPSGYTNIGAALQKANELLENGDKNLPSVIILLSDGETEMPSAPETEASMAVQKNAISDAKNNGTQIYCIGLNANGRIKQDEFANISQQTNGVFQIVSRADDLKDVFKHFYKLIYGTGGAEIQGVALPSVKEFIVPEIGVEEVNILIDGQPSSVGLTQPSGVTLSADEINSMISKGEHFTNIKIEKPMGGTWKLELDGQPGQTVTINFIPNLNVSLVAKKADTESYKRGENVEVVTSIISDGNEVTDNSIYQQYPATLTITKANDASNIQTVEATAIDGKYKVNMTFDETGTYYITPSIDIGYGQISGNTININVGNMVPKPKNDRFSFTEYVLGFGKKSFIYDLNQFVTDDDGEQLTFSIDKCSFNSDEIDEESLGEISEEGILNICPLKAAQGELNIIATDESGASCEFTLEIIYKDLLKFILMVLMIAILTVIILFVIIKHIITHRAFNGSVAVVAFDEDDGEISAPMTEWPAKRPINIETINIDSNTLGGIRGTFYGTGKDYIIFSVKGTGFWNGIRARKVKIYDGCTERISSREDGTKGVEITFTKQDGNF